jgi:thiosulfate dehydrogenase
MKRQMKLWLGLLLVVLTSGAAELVSAGDPTSPGMTPQRRYIQSPQLDKALVKKSMEEIAKLVKMGDDLWHDRSLGTNGMACNMCHPDATVSHPETFPKYKAQLGRVVTAQQMINWCIQVPLQGKGFAVGSLELTALEAYMADQNKGQVLETGLPSP